ncbi:glycosyltransferase family 4 protein [Rossellomorea vietnamensis]|uniref:Glycosyl transferase family 1 n=1 Tax=Rossellomorea vietnamensis TaxID=218284 RepID=A0A0P6WC88_9BACI|nr:glycosyltransferase family 4 protein [Rossellomorea vietnamensis]KPL57692.1 glycosyl transferase family 1 [Rossellomorea vietnamensis]
MTKVSILTHSFLDAYNNKIDKVYGGGLERYLYELCLILKGMGVEVEIHQLSFNDSFRTQLETTDLEGTVIYGYFCDDLEKIPDIFSEMSSKASGKLIYASCIWHPIHYKQDSLGICHGINWDRVDLAISMKDHVKENVQRALNSLRKIVSVDSHFLSYCRSTCFYEDNEKVELIPNFVDTKRFTPSAPSSPDGSIKLLFPRRISHERGIILMMAATDILLDRFPQLEIIFAGETIDHTPLSSAFYYWMNTHPHKTKIRHQVYSFDAMPKVYEQADMAVIPTIFSEGTSLSCLEALSAGLPIVSTNIGGLNDIIIDGYNGLLITPTVDRLVASVSELLQDTEKREEIASRARETAEAFDISIWKKRWGRVLEDYL